MFIFVLGIHYKWGRRQAYDLTLVLYMKDKKNVLEDKKKLNDKSI